MCGTSFSVSWIGQRSQLLTGPERLRREKAAAEGNYPGDEEDEEAQVQRAMDLSTAEAEFRRGRGGGTERRCI